MSDPIKPFDIRDFPQPRTQSTNADISDVKDRFSDMATKVRDQAGQIVETVSEKLDRQRENAAEGLDRAASTMHDRAESVPGGPRLVNMTHSIADGMGSTASYLREHDVGTMGNDVVDICRRYPKQSLVAALAIGFLIGRSRR
jgi:hypothetical protein